jgi:U32 family peptidase
MKKPELLLPVGNREMCLAAIHHGADAIYVGMPGFNARGRTVDHSFDELKEMIELCHSYDVKVHVAFNILIFEDELEKARDDLYKLLPLKPDALIVQDLGLVKLIHEIAPKQVVHASTQMTVTNELAIALTSDLNIARYVLGRENSLPEIELIKENTNKELEVFIHGALCVAYSGQCFTSESIGGRSANRGQCAQSCRFSYDLIVDGVKKDLVDRDYLVSPKDLCGLEEVEALAKIGVDSLKVEGRLKGPDYVASAAKAYRQAIDTKVSPKDLKVLKKEMGLTYSRGFFPGWLHGVNHQELVDGTFPHNRGLEIGSVLKVSDKFIEVKSSEVLYPGDGLLFIADKEFGTSIYEVECLKPPMYRLKFARDFSLKSIKVGQKIYLNSRPGLKKELERAYTDKKLGKKFPARLMLVGQVGKVLELHAQIAGLEFKVLGDSILEAAKKEIVPQLMQKELVSLGEHFEVEKIKLQLSKPNPFIPNQFIKNLKKELLLEWKESCELPEVSIKPYEFKKLRKAATEATPFLRLLLRSKDQVKALGELYQEIPALKAKLHSVIMDFEFGQDYQSSLDFLRVRGIKAAIATNRILKPGEYHHLKNILRMKPDYILARNLGAIKFIKDFDPEMIIAGDFSLNVSNSMTAEYLMSKGVESLSLSYDLNQDQLIKLVENSEYKNFEVTIHQYMPSFHMEHCVFAAFLSKGKSFRDCGKPCEKHQVELKDQFGNRHFLKADQECRNTMFNATAITASGLIEKLSSLGVSLFRLEFLQEDKAQMKHKLEAYVNLLTGKITTAELQRNLGESEFYGLSTGQLFKSDSYQDRKNI